MAAWPIRIAGLSALLLLATVFAPDRGHAQDCAPRTSVRIGETTEQIAQRCGINVERLKAANPGLLSNSPQAGGFLNTPSPSLPSPSIEIGGNRAISTPRPATPQILLPVSP